MIEQPLTLPCGGVLSNRLCKAAMTEGLAGADGIPGAALNRLYGIWSDGGAGLLLSSFAGGMRPQTEYYLPAHVYVSGVMSVPHKRGGECGIWVTRDWHAQIAEVCV